MRVKGWFDARGPKYIEQRAKSLLARYQLSPSKAFNRIDACLEGLADQGCFPTFPTPGIVLQKYPRYFRHIQEFGAELAVHGYQHLDLSTYPVNEARDQLLRAVNIFKDNEIEVHGFRCPYLGYSDELLDALPKGLFEYSSNQSIYWDCLDNIDTGSHNGNFETLRKIYRARPSSDILNVPWNRPNMIEIPISMPDDMELFDGLQLTPEGVSNIWCKVLNQIHQRGELFNLIFHPELADICERPFLSILNCAKSLEPHVWMARLRDISEWWSEKSNFTAEMSLTSTGLRIDFTCSPRATILVRGFDLRDSGSAWDGAYQWLHAKTLEIPTSPRPFLGIPATAPQKVISCLKAQGYILDMAETASSCGIYLDETILSGLDNEIALINYVEASTVPLVRYWRWPNGAKCALSVTGDLDALSLSDYFSRILKS